MPVSVQNSYQGAPGENFAGRATPGSAFAPLLRNGSAAFRIPSVLQGVALIAYHIIENKCKAEIIGLSDPAPHAVQFSGCIGNFDLEWTDGIAIIEKELDSSYTDAWSDDKSAFTISFALLTVKDNWNEPCYKETEFNFGEEVDLKTARGGNNIITSVDSLAGKKIKLTFTETKETIKCKAEIVE
ncbi:MAG: hypothetical protein HDR52_01250 [Treponema sp.]|nr:hypothetical protein [Treponema sp.]